MSNTKEYKELQIVDQKEIEFQGDTLLTMQDQNGDVWSALKPKCEGLGILAHGQAKKIKDGGVIRYTDICVPSKGGPQQAFCIHVDDIPYWLSTISVHKVKPEHKDKLLAYQRECIDVLKSYWIDGEALNPRKYDPESIKDGEPVRPLRTFDLFNHTDRTSREIEFNIFWSECNNLISLMNTTDDWYLKEYCSMKLQERLDQAFIKMEMKEPKLGEFKPLTKLYFMFLVGECGWTKDMIKYKYRAYIRTDQEWKQWLKDTGIQLPARYPCLDQRLERDIAKHHLILKETKEELLFRHKTTLNCVNGAIKRVKEHVQTEMDQHACEADQYMSYWLYLNSLRWIRKRNSFIAVFDACEHCGQSILGKNNIELHHRDYRRVGTELVDDLVPLCKECHAEAHRQDRAGTLSHDHDQQGEVVEPRRSFVSNNPNAPQPPQPPHLRAIK